MSSLNDFMLNYSFDLDDVDQIWAYYDMPLSGTIVTNGYTLVFNATFSDSNQNSLMLFSHIPAKLLRSVVKRRTPFRAVFTDIRSVLFREVENTYTGKIHVVPFDRKSLTEAILPERGKFVY